MYKVGDRVLYNYNVSFGEGAGLNLLGAKGVVIDLDPNYVKCKWSPRDVNKRNFGWWVPPDYIRLLRDDETQ